MAHLRVFGRFLREYSGIWIKSRHIPDNASFLHAAYRSFLGREPDADGFAHYVQALSQKRTTKLSIIRSMIQSREFRQRHGLTVADDTLFLQDAYHVLLQRELDEETREYHLAALRHNRMTRQDVLRAIIQSDEFQQLNEQSIAGNELFLRDVYQALLKRDIDKDGLNHYLQARRKKRLTRQDVLRTIVESDEFRQIYGLPMHPLDASHQSRMMLFQRCLPPAEVIVDLGGAAHEHPEGALLAMGYPHHPRQIYIVDLPPKDRIGGAERAEQSQELVTDGGTHIRYLYRSMTDLSLIDDQSADLVVSGESIEHISEADADIVCQEVYRILKPGGYFCLDTPNGALKRLQSPDEMIHPEHQKEYYVHELKDKLERWGFEIVEAKAICPMPQSLQSGVFDYAEMVDKMGLSDNPEEGYMFFFKAIKPARSA